MSNEANLGLLRGSTTDENVEPTTHSADCCKIFEHTTRIHSKTALRNAIAALKPQCLFAPAHLDLLFQNGVGWRYFNVTEAFSKFSFFPKGDVATAMQNSAEKMEDHINHGQKLDDHSYELLPQKSLHLPGNYFHAYIQLESYYHLGSILFGSNSIIAHVLKGMVHHMYEMRERYMNQSNQKNLNKMILYGIDMEVQELINSCKNASVPFADIPFSNLHS